MVENTTTTIRTVPDYDDRLGTSIAEDVAAFAGDAEPVYTRPTRETASMLVDDDNHYTTGVHCRRCFCDVAVTQRGTGETYCPNCETLDENNQGAA